MSEASTAQHTQMLYLDHETVQSRFAVTTVYRPPVKLTATRKRVRSYTLRQAVRRRGRTDLNWGRLTMINARYPSMLTMGHEPKWTSLNDRDRRTGKWDSFCKPKHLDTRPERGEKKKPHLNVLELRDTIVSQREHLQIHQVLHA